MELEALKLLNDPPDTVISPTTKSLVASTDVKVRVKVLSFVVAPSVTALEPLEAVMAMVCV